LVVWDVCGFEVLVCCVVVLFLLGRLVCGFGVLACLRGGDLVACDTLDFRCFGLGEFACGLEVL